MRRTGFRFLSGVVSQTNSPTNPNLNEKLIFIGELVYRFQKNSGGITLEKCFATAKHFGKVPLKRNFSDEASNEKNTISRLAEDEIQI